MIKGCIRNLLIRMSHDHGLKTIQVMDDKCNYNKVFPLSSCMAPPALGLNVGTTNTSGLNLRAGGYFVLMNPLLV
jgi:hypothetical protein